MATFSVNDQARRAQSTGNGSATDFSFSFQVNATSDIKVYIGDTLKTLSTHYTIVDSSSSAGLNTDGTGVVKFITSPTDYTPADGDVVTILSDVPVARTSVYTSGGNITAASLESDFDTITMQVADREERDARQLTAPVSDPTSIDMTLPAKASRLGKALGFNSSSGNPEAITVYQTAADVRAAVEAASDSNVFTDADHSKLDGIAASANNYSHPNHTGDVTSSGDGATTIAADAVTGAKIADDAVDSEHIANGAIDLAHMSANSVDSDQYVDGSIDTAHIGDDQVTYAKIQNVSATNVVLGRDSSGAGVIEEISASSLRTILNVEDGATADQSASEIKTAYESNSDTNAFTDAEKTKLSGVAASANNYSHPNHSGEVTSTADGATVIADNVVDEANLKVSNSPTNGYVLTAQSGNTGGLTWAAASSGSDLTIKEEGTALSTAATSLDFVGASVTASGTGADKTITISSDAANLTGTLPAISGANLTGVQAASVNVTESSDDNVDYNILFSDTANSGTVQMTPVQDDNGLTFNPSTNRLYSAFAYHQQVSVDSYVYHQGDTNTWMQFDDNDSIKFATGGTERLHLNSSGVQINNAFTLPTADGSANQVLTAAGDGTTSWAAASGGGSDPDLYRDNASSATTPSATGSNAVAVGNNSVASGTDSLALGAYANATGFRGVAVGRYVYATSTSSNAFGVNAHSAEQDTVALGNARAFGGSYASAMAVGNNSTSYGAGAGYSLAFGFLSKAHNANSIAIGRSATVTHDDSVALGRNAASSAANEITLGSTSHSVRVSSAYTLPSSDGTAGQVLSTDGSGNLSWVDP